MWLESAITPAEGRCLVGLARAAIEAAVEDRPLPEPATEELTEGMLRPLGAFVTLHKQGELRGCIGRMQYDTALYRCVIESAVASALRDPRFEPVTADELPLLRIEVSVLDEPQPIERIEELDVDRHGIVMELGSAHGVFLPKVAREYGWDREKTLAMLCRKVGLPEDAWLDPRARFKVFHAIEFAEEQP
jgi:AmmeMemoRadiSam system protein A